MNPVIRAAVIYIFLLLVFRIIGKRSLSQTTTFDFILLLIIGEATQQALIGEDYSITSCFIVVFTLVGIDMLFSQLKEKSILFENIMESTPLLVVENGKPIKSRLKKCRIDEIDILEAARLLHGLERMDQIKYAVLERNGKISIIPVSK